MDTNINILIADDMLMMRKLVQRALQEMGFKNITAANDGQEAYDLLMDKSKKFHMILSDWNMPRMTGVQLLKKVREDEALKNLPFLLITAETEKHQIVEAALYNVDGYIIKPFKPVDLHTKIEKVLAKKAS